MLPPLFCRCLQDDQRERSAITACIGGNRRAASTWNCRKLHVSAHRFFWSSSTALLVSKYWYALWWLNSPCG